MAGDYYVHDWTKSRFPCVRAVLEAHSFTAPTKREALDQLRSHLSRVCADLDREISAEVEAGKGGAK